jgi:hypothetical protein
MIFLSVAYLRGKDNEIVAKEVGYVKLEANGIDVSAQCFHFKAPYSACEIPAKIRESNTYVSSEFHGIKWEDGYIAYNQLPHILTRLCRDETCKIYAKGSEQRKFFTEQCMRAVRDLDVLGCARADQIKLTNPNTSCSLRHTNHCAMNKCMKYADWMRTELLSKKLTSSMNIWGGESSSSGSDGWRSGSRATAASAYQTQLRRRKDV